MNVPYEHIGPLIEAWAIVSDAYFDMAQGLYWFAADYHGGMSDPLYGILSTLGYGPAPSERGPDTEVSMATYEFLASLQGVEQIEAALELQDYIGRRSAVENPPETKDPRARNQLYKPEYMLIYGPDRSHDGLYSERFALLRDARSAAVELEPERYWRILRISGGRGFTQQQVDVIAVGGPDEERRKARERFKRQYERARREK